MTRACCAQREEEEGSATQSSVPLPINVGEATDLGTRELAYAAQRYGKAARRDATDFEAVYNHGLALQELALRAVDSRQEQLGLLEQVLTAPIQT